VQPHLKTGAKNRAELALFQIIRKTDAVTQDKFTSNRRFLIPAESEVKDAAIAGTG
jgi:hypothetical protein